MRKNKFCLLPITMAFVFLLTGCGTKMYDITEEEQQIIAEAAASIIAKHNTYQKDGMNASVYDEEALAEMEKENNQKNEDAANDNPNASSSNDIESDLPVVSLSEAIKAGEDVRVKYTGYKLDKSYQEGGYYSVNAESGKTYVIMSFTIKNLGEEDATIDAIAANSKFSACFDGQTWIFPEETFLTYSLITYQGTLKEGKSANVVLLFSIKESDTEKITDPKMKVELDGEVCSVKL
ncbi:MAG: DUF4352 domain-containing protein [Agathobacter sp.]|nr:DUF4352 domain-containing protein [Agathobacter sp.]